MVDYTERLACAMKHAGASKPALAKAVGISYQAVKKVLDGGSRSLTAENNAKAARFLGVSSHWLATGEGEMLDGMELAPGGLAGLESGGDDPGATIAQLVEAYTGETRESLMGRIKADIAWTDLASKNTVAVPVLHVKASMGYGEDTLDEEAVAGVLRLGQEWVNLHLRGHKLDKLRFIHGHGDSMAPTFNSGDILLVDAAVNDVKVDGIYVLSAHDRLFIKRVRQRLDGAFEISSDNPAHKTVDVLNGGEAVTVHGRVVWAWNGKKV